MEVIKAVRARVSPRFAVAVKLNSADFQRGGFNDADALAVLKLLNELPVDLVELSGGSYESPAMQGCLPMAAPWPAKPTFWSLPPRLAGQLRHACR